METFICYGQSMSTVRAVQYYRVSPRAGRDMRSGKDAEADSIEKQQSMAQGIAASRGWRLIDPPYVDKGISASKKNVKRPAYDRMVEDYRAGKFEAIICYDLDRLSRQPRQLEDWIDAAEANELRLVTLNGEADLSTDGGRMYARIKAAVARGEVERTSRRIRDASDLRAQKGGIHSGFRPFGYEADQMTVIESEASLIRTALAEVLAGRSFNSIAQEWNDKGVRSVRAQVSDMPPSWSTTSIKTLVLNPRYAGLRVHRGEVIGEAAWPAIVSVDEQEALRTILSRRKGVYGGPGGRLPSAMLTRIATCGVCKGPMIRGTTRHGPRVSPIYTCKRYRCATAPTKELDAFIETLVTDMLSSPDSADLLDPDRDPEIETLEAEKVNLNDRLIGLATDYAEGLLTREQMVAGTETLRGRLEATEERLRNLANGHILDGLSGASDIERAWGKLSMDRKRAVIQWLMAIEIHPRGRGTKGGFMPEKIEWSWKHEKTPALQAEA